MWLKYARFSLLIEQIRTKLGNSTNNAMRSTANLAPKSNQQFVDFYCATAVCVNALDRFSDDYETRKSNCLEEVCLTRYDPLAISPRVPSNWVLVHVVID